MTQIQDKNNVLVKLSPREYQSLKPILTELRLLYAKEIEEDFSEYEVAFDKPIDPKILLKEVGKYG
ncbi:MAG: hypothetical protein LBQ59_03165 [Candidatus Peribacteria bacterium]|jgi:hypothetical protein|nr:hypothetical protein [Candidatus Peribacteria bacterium]